MTKLVSKYMRVKHLTEHPYYAAGEIISLIMVYTGCHGSAVML